MPTTTITSGVARSKSMGFFVSALVALSLMAGCGGGGAQQGVSQEQSAPPATGTFVGKASDEDAFVAIVAASPEEEEGQERDFRAYLCDGEDVTEWFTGRAEGNELNLTSEGDARLEGNLTTEASTGTITLEEDRTLTYTAELARGVAGLYNVTILEEGGVRGTSETGGLLEGQLGGEAEMRGEEARLIIGTFTSAEGQEVGFEVFGREPIADEYRWSSWRTGRPRGRRRERPRDPPRGS